MTHASPPAPQLTQDRREPKIIYGPQGQVIKEVGVPSQVPFGFSKTKEPK